MERSVRMLLTLLALLTGLSAAAAQADVRQSARHGIEQVQPGQRVGALAARLEVGNSPAAKRAWRATGQNRVPEVPQTIARPIEYGDRALE